MEIVTTLADFSVVVFAIVLFFAQLIAHEIGYSFGHRQMPRVGAKPEAVGVAVGGMLGLLAFVLALTLSFANTRFSERRLGSLNEANAIGTSWLRAKAIEGPQAAEIARLLESYIKVRAEFVGADRDRTAVESLNVQTSELQSKIWGNLALIVREQPNPISNSLMVSLNDTFDAATSERFAFDMRLPPQLFWLLIGMTLLSMACLGYQFGIRENRLRVLVGLLTVMWTSIIIVILDLSAARVGYIRTNTVIYEQTLEGFRSGINVPSQ